MCDDVCSATLVAVGESRDRAAPKGRGSKQMGRMPRLVRAPMGKTSMRNVDDRRVAVRNVSVRAIGNAIASVR
jgi:hypothetical protein